MPLLHNGQWVEHNPWERLDDETPLPETPVPGQAVLCSLRRFLELESTGLNTVSGVWLDSDDDVTQLAAHLNHIQVIAIDFPAFTDGRGYSQARVLRQQLGFAGELRAIGDIRPDQLLFMVRAGIDSFVFDEAQDEALIKQIMSRFKVNYQPSYALPMAG